MNDTLFGVGMLEAGIASRSHRVPQNDRPKGPYFYDIRTEGGGVVGQNVTIVMICCLNRTETRGRGDKNPKILWTLFTYGPLGCGFLRVLQRYSKR